MMPMQTLPDAERDACFQFEIDLIEGLSARQLSQIEAILAAHAAPGDLRQLRDEVDEVLDAMTA
jgi:hypothetical protein